MSTESWFFIIIGLVIFNYLFSNILDFINHKNSLKIKYKIRNYGLKSIFNRDPLKNKFLAENTYHFLQTDSSKIYLRKKYFVGKNNTFKNM